MILPVFEPIVPALLGAAGAILVLAGILVIAHHRHRALVPLGVLTVLAGVTIAAPTTVADATRTAVTATSTALTGLTDRVSPVRDDSAAEVMAGATEDPAH